MTSNKLLIAIVDDDESMGRAMERLARSLAVMPMTAFAAGTGASNSPTGDLLLLDELERVVVVQTNEVPSEFRPATDNWNQAPDSQPHYRIQPAPGDTRTAT